MAGFNPIIYGRFWVITEDFKNEVAQRMGRDGADYTDALHDVWRTMYRLQESETRQGWS